MMMDASRSLLLFVISILSLACRTASLAAEWLGSISWALEDTCRLLQALVAAHSPRTKQAARKASTATVDVSSTTNNTGAEITRLQQVIGELRSQLLKKKALPQTERPEEVARSSQDEILNIRQEMSSTVSGLEGEVAALKKHLRAVEVEKKRMKGEYLFNVTRIHKKVQEEKSNWEDVEEDNKRLLLEKEDILREMEGLRLQLEAKEGKVLDTQGTLDLVKREKKARDMNLERMEKVLKDKNMEIELLKKEVEEREMRLKEDREAEGKDLWLQVAKRTSYVEAL